MFKLLFASLILLPLCSNFAFAGNDTSKREILRLTREVEDVLLDSKANAQTLADVKSHLEDAIDLLKKGDSGSAPDNDCVNIAYEAYYKSLSSTQAMDKAVAACRGNQSTIVLKLLFDKYYQSLSATPAMDKAAEYAKQDVEDKEDMIEFAFDKYYMSLSSTPAITKAAEGAINTPARSLSCLRSRFDIYYKSMSSTPAMDAAFKACQ